MKPDTHIPILYRNRVARHQLACLNLLVQNTRRLTPALLNTRRHAFLTAAFSFSTLELLNSL